MFFHVLWFVLVHLSVLHTNVTSVCHKKVSSHTHLSAKFVYYLAVTQGQDCISP